MQDVVQPPEPFVYYREEDYGSVGTEQHGDMDPGEAPGRKCEELAEKMQNEYRIKASHYNAEVNPLEKMATQREWQAGRIQVIFATVCVCCIQSYFITEIMC